jgi:hypothetical protein
VRALQRRENSVYPPPAKANTTHYLFPFTFRLWDNPLALLSEPVSAGAFGFGEASSFTYVRLTDDPNEGNSTGYSVGADIDAVCALTSTLVDVVPGLQPLGTVSLVVLVILVTTCGRFWATGSKAS